jgi:hypothetical protein
MMSDALVDDASIKAALESYANPLRASVNTLSEAASRYGEVMLYNQPGSTKPDGVLSFNNTVTNNIGGTDYTFKGFDIWTIKNSDSGTSYGPVVYDAGKQFALKANTTLIQSMSAWQNKTGDISITVKPPASSYVKSYIVVR